MSDLCPVAVAKDSTEDQCQPESAAESHLLLLKQKKYCNVTFTFPNLPDRIEAHKFCLKARSPVFAEIFRTRKSGNVQGNEIQIRESSPEIFQQFLEFIYADKLERDIAGALNLLQLAQKYKVHPLIKKCEDLLQTKIPVQDSVKVFEAARRYGRQELMDRAGQIMVKSFRELVRTYNRLAYAGKETLEYLLNCDDLCVKEVELFEFILKWGKLHLGPSAGVEVLRDVLKDLIPRIRYTNMSPEEFTKVVVPTRLLTKDDTISVFYYFCGDDITRQGLTIKFTTTRRKVEHLEKATGKPATFSELPFSGAEAGDLVAAFEVDFEPSRKSPLSRGPSRFQRPGSHRSLTEGKPPPRTTAVKFGSGEHKKQLESASTFTDVLHPHRAIQFPYFWPQSRDVISSNDIFPALPVPSVNMGRRCSGSQDDRGAGGGRNEHRNRFPVGVGGARDYGLEGDGNHDFSDGWGSSIRNRDQVHCGGMNQSTDHRKGPSACYRHTSADTSSYSDVYDLGTYEVPHDPDWE